MNPPSDGEATPNVGNNAPSSALPLVAPTPISKRVRVVVTATVAEPPGTKPVTVINPLPEMVALAPLLAVARQVYCGSKLVIWRKNPLAVRVSELNVGINPEAFAAAPINLTSAI